MAGPGTRGDMCDEGWGDRGGKGTPSAIRHQAAVPYSTEWGGHYERWISATRHWRSMIAPIGKKRMESAHPPHPVGVGRAVPGWHPTSPRFSSAPPDDEAGGSCTYVYPNVHSHCSGA